MPARAIDTATIAFGLVSIPIKIYSTTEPSHEIHFHLIHEGCGERLKQKYVCPKHGQVERADMTKGFELSKGTFVELSKDELKALEAVSSNEVEIREFVPASAVDPIFVDRTYFLGPGKGGDRSYRLLRDALEDAELVGIAAYSARGKQYVVMVRPFEDGLAMHQLRYPDEVKDWSEVPLGKLPKAAPAELGLARQIIGQLEHSAFDPTQYTDEVKGRVRTLIADKAKGGEIVAPPEAPKPVMTDLLAALKASLAGERKPAGEAAAKAAANGKAATATNGKAAAHDNGSNGKAAHGKAEANGNATTATNGKAADDKHRSNGKAAHGKAAHGKAAAAHGKAAHGKAAHGKAEANGGAHGKPAANGKAATNGKAAHGSNGTAAAARAASIHEQAHGADSRTRAHRAKRKGVAQGHGTRGHAATPHASRGTRHPLRNHAAPNTSAVSVKHAAAGKHAATRKSAARSTRTKRAATSRVEG